MYLLYDDAYLHINGFFFSQSAWRSERGKSALNFWVVSKWYTWVLTIASFSAGLALKASIRVFLLASSSSKGKNQWFQSRWTRWPDKIAIFRTRRPGNNGNKKMDCGTSGGRVVCHLVNGFQWRKTDNFVFNFEIQKIIILYSEY